MDEFELSRLMSRLPARSRAPGADCGDEVRISAYVDSRLDAATRERFELHLADCPDCLSQVAFLARLAATTPSAAVPARLLDAAAARSRRPRLRFAPALAAAAVVCAVAAVTLLTPTPEPPPAERQTTRASAASTIPRILAPREGENVARSQLEIRWQGVPEALFYRLQLMNSAGNVLWEGRAEEVRMLVPEDLALEGRGPYYAWVEAHLRGGVSVRSRATLFELSAP